MARATLEKILNAKRMDNLFKRTAEKQYTRQLMFSSVVQLMSEVVFGVQPSVHAAYQARAESLGVSNQAVYDKLDRIEPNISAELVRDSARQTMEITAQLDAKLPPLLEGYRTKILDGNHLSASEHRIEELRGTWAAPLPGKVLVVLDQERMTAVDAFPCEDGHAQERSMLDQVAATVELNDFWIADRNFCVIDFMANIESRGGVFLIRQHGLLKGELLGKRKYCGKNGSAKVFEQAIRVTSLKGTTLELRRVTIELKTPTRDGDREIHLLSNVPAEKADAVRLAELYLKRWTIETMFQELTETLTCEVKALGYPRAALFGFCLALVAYNAVAVVKAALRARLGREQTEKISAYYLSLEISQTYAGMMIAIPERHWRMFFALSVEDFAKALRRIADHVDLRRYRKHPRGRKKPPPKKSTYRHGGHLSTAKVLALRKET